jgi:hypothetical protein
MPAIQAVHSASVDAVEYLPTAQAVHALAPVSVPALVIDPAAQVVHAFALETAEYVPAAHLAHELAPVAAPVLVIDPAMHTSQNACALEP